MLNESRNYHNNDNDNKTFIFHNFYKFAQVVSQNYDECMHTPNEKFVGH